MKNRVNNLFYRILNQSQVKYAFVNGFDKYIVCDNRGTLFVVGYNPETKKYGLGRTKLMLQEYAKEGLPVDVMPDFPLVYKQAETSHYYYVYKSLLDLYESEFNSFLRNCGRK